MKSIVRLMAVCITLFFSLTTAHANQITVSAWHYQDGDRLPLADAAFLLRSEAGASAILATDESGTLTFSQLPAGQYTLTQLDSPALYRALPRPLFLSLGADGTLLVNGRRTGQVSILYRSGEHLLTCIVLFLSLLPMLFRLLWSMHSHRAAESIGNLLQKPLFFLPFWGKLNAASKISD